MAGWWGGWWEEGLRERDQGAGFNTDLGAGKAACRHSSVSPYSSQGSERAFERADGMGKSIGLICWSAQCDVGNLELCGQFSS